MRVLQVAHALPPATYGGTELYTRDLAEALAGRGHEVAVAAPRGADESSGSDPCWESDRERPAVETFDLPDPGGETAPAVGERPLDAVVRPAVDDRFRDLLAEWDPDVVHLQHVKHLSATLPSLCESQGVASVATLHDFWTICHREQLYRPEERPCSGPASVEKCADCYRRAAVEDGRATDGGTAGRASDDRAVDVVARRDEALREALSATNRLVAPSRFLRDTFVAFGASAERVEQCRNGIRVERFEDTGFDPDSRLRIGYAGRVTERKGVHLLAAAAGEVEAADLHIFGRFDPESDDYHARLAATADEATTFHGWYADRATPYREMDVLVLPSVWYENSPLVIQEAFASGVPVVTADVGGMAELVRDGEDGLTFPVGDADGLRDALSRLARNADLVADLRDGVTEPKRLRDHAAEIADLYADCVGASEAGAGEGGEGSR
ncbi:glycosyltransferase family 4 protein [Halorussus sp. MSC15.2]|uniref:glycosyltransferase family 4 protein n=1 Tax=Halorussus sp. MSC15.2 TaxID=2283638 RepID=UPI0013D4BD1F|nr:glycosyltransferase family 4 protein [Halorussus sp. MSC15.2]NEU56564.1 glycosyltransferase family 4 protein [Halorussus sp. MSC15.2]